MTQSENVCTGNAWNAQNSFRWQCHAEKTNFWVVLSIQTWGNFGLRFWAFRSSLDKLLRRKRGESSQNRQRTPTKHHYGDFWQVRPLLWNTAAHSEDLNMRHISGAHCFVCAAIFGR
jgi:hypothetical protein